MLADVRTRLLLWRASEVGEGCHVFGRIWVHGGGHIRLGRRVVLDARRAPIELHAEPGAELVLDDDVRIEEGSSLEATRSVVIGPRTVIAGFVKVIDNHFHSPSGERNARPESRTVTVEADVRVGSNAVLLPGAYLGAGTQVAPGSVVSKRVPANSFVEGNPPRVRSR